ncbi:hypothetical protein GDO81_017823 [Engystomops pustulosus]|uniref:Ankyrin repeat domain-containing protein 45 n=1 Tax=Engystomops pustulosus TaxID=76066 RepID=A0AAV7AAT0_ENGPU|nr:hypothetical protein GDO81_017823 [Engystomops pustulosus]
MNLLTPPSQDNPVLQCALEGNVQGLQSIFEDPENDHHEQSGTLLVEEDLLGRNPLFLACILGRTEVVKELAKYGANINQQTARGYSPLHSAAAWGQVDVIKALVDLGGDILLLNFRGEKPCEIATRYNKTECADFLKWAEPGDQCLQIKNGVAAEHQGSNNTRLPGSAAAARERGAAHLHKAQYTTSRNWKVQDRDITGLHLVPIVLKC